MSDAWGSDVRVVISGLTNTYSSYVTTWEEYAAQRYEGASTLFGPSTLDAYIQVAFGLGLGDVVDGILAEDSFPGTGILLAALLLILATSNGTRAQGFELTHH